MPHLSSLAQWTPLDTQVRWRATDLTSCVERAHVVPVSTSGSWRPPVVDPEAADVRAGPIDEEVVDRCWMA